MQAQGHCYDPRPLCASTASTVPGHLHRNCIIYDTLHKVVVSSIGIAAGTGLPGVPGDVRNLLSLGDLTAALAADFGGGGEGEGDDHASGSGLSRLICGGCSSDDVGLR